MIMMKSKFLAWGGMLFALCAMLAVTSCSSDDDENGGSNPTPPTPDVVNGMTTATFMGIVAPEGWGILQGVTVTSGDQTTQTDFNGMYKLDKVKVVGGRAVLKFKKQGYMTVVRSVPVQSSVRLDVSMMTCGTQSFPATSAKSITVGWGEVPMTVELPADGYVTESGTAYTGDVTAQYVYLDPDDEDFPNQMPGDLTALRTDNSDAQLVSYGMVAVELTDATGNKLQLAPGQKAKVTFPVPDRFKGSTLPASIPLWSFNDETGLWVEEGVANLDGAGTAYVGEVAHFSWHNLDSPELRATLKVKVLDNAGKAVPGVQVNIDGQRTARTDNDGIATCTVPSNTNMLIWVPSEAYGNYAEVLDEYGWAFVDATKIVRQNVTLAPQETKTITLTMPSKIPVISGKVTNEGSGTQLCVVYIQYGHSETPHYFSDYNGKFSLMAPSVYRGPATIVAQYGDGYKVQKAITITDEDQVIDLTANTNSDATPGILMVLGEGINLRYQLPDASDQCWKSVIIDENGLRVGAYVNHQEMGVWGDVSLYIPDYVEGQNTFTSDKNSFNYMMEGSGGWTQLQSQGKFTVNVTKSGDNYTFKIANADATLVDRSLGMDWETAASVKFTVEFTAQPGETYNEDTTAY